MGYIEETGVAQHYRDIRIAPIYEGTNGIQAIDLVGRKLGLRGGAAIAGYLDSDRCDGGRGDGGWRRAWLRSATRWPRRWRPCATVTDWLLAARGPNDTLAGATPYLRMIGIATGAWLLARSALAAATASAARRRLPRQKLVTAHFFACQILPQAAGLAPAVTSGAADLFTATL